MKAVQIHRYGEPAVLRLDEIPIPEPAAGELLIRAHAASINPVDVKTRTGSAGLAGRYGTESFPLILGWDISGVVEQLGEGVTGFEVGDEVYGMPRFPDVASAYAEYVTAPTGEIAHKPTSLDHLQAAALPLVALTTWQALFKGTTLESGQKILVHAAAGGVGHVAVQIAKWKGAFVAGTASKGNAEFLTEIGVDQFVDYQTQRFEDVLSDFDVVLDTVRGEVRERSWQVLKPDGILVSITGPPSAETAAQHGVRATSILVRPSAEELGQITTLVDEGKLKPKIDAVYPLALAAQAHAHVANGHTSGKVVLQISN